MTGEFCSSPIPSFHVETNVLFLDLHSESLAMKALLHPYLLPSSPLCSLLASEDLANSSKKFALLVHPGLLDVGIMCFNDLELNSQVPFLGLFLLFISVDSC